MCACACVCVRSVCSFSQHHFRKKIVWFFAITISLGLSHHAGLRARASRIADLLLLLLLLKIPPRPAALRLRCRPRQRTAPVRALAPPARQARARTPQTAAAARRQRRRGSGGSGGGGVAARVFLCRRVVTLHGRGRCASLSSSNAVEHVLRSECRNARAACAQAQHVALARGAGKVRSAC